MNTVFYTSFFVLHQLIFWGVIFEYPFDFATTLRLISSSSTHTQICVLELVTLSASALIQVIYDFMIILKSYILSILFRFAHSPFIYIYENNKKLREENEYLKNEKCFIGKML